MNKLLSFVCGAALVGSLAAHAADTSSSVQVRKSVTPVGVSPQVGYVHVTASATNIANGFTFDLPVPFGRRSADIVGFMGNLYSPSGSVKTATMIRSGATVAVSNSNMTSGTVANGDIVRGIVIYNP
jgi:hypothetical protein